MKILGLIPARGGSKGIPGKNIKELGGKPLIAWSIEAGAASSLETIVVSTDSEEIAEVARTYSARVPSLRPAELAGDKTPTLPVVHHVVKELSALGEEYDAVMLLQATSPYRMPGEIDEAISIFEKSEADSLISVKAVPHEYNPEWIFFSDDNGHLRISTGREKIITRRQDLPEAYIRDGSIYITSVDCLLNKDSLFGDTISYYERDQRHYVNLDTMDDWEMAEQLLDTYLTAIKG